MGVRFKHRSSVMLMIWIKPMDVLVLRTYEVFESMPMLKNWSTEWPSIAQIIRVTRYRERLRSKQTPSHSVHYYVSNSCMSALEYAHFIRQHWFIENKLHYVKDVAFQEDSHVKRVNPFIYSTCIDIGLNKLRALKMKNIKNTLYKASLDFFGFLEINGINIIDF